MVDKCEDIEPKARNKYPMKSPHDVVPTFRPQLRVHLMNTKLSNDTSEGSPQQVRRKKPLVGLDTLNNKSRGKSSFGESFILNKNQNRSKLTPKRKKIKLQERIGNGGSSPKNSVRRMDTDATSLDYVDEVHNSDIDFFDARTRKKWNLCKRRASQKERKIDDNPTDTGMPEFEHFPIRELNKANDENSEKNLDLECQQLVQRFVAEKSSHAERSKRPKKKKTSLPLLTPDFKSESFPTSINRNTKKTIINEQLRQQIQLQDIYSNTPIE